MHAKIAVLESAGGICVFLSSNNWQAGGNHEFIEMIDNIDACMTIKNKMHDALQQLKPVEPAG